jgi:PHP family Zn ribbon phosphoesterase
MHFQDLPKEQQEKLVSDVFCIQCQKSFRLEQFTEREFRGVPMIEGRCPQCGNTVAKPIGSRM